MKKINIIFGLLCLVLCFADFSFAQRTKRANSQRQIKKSSESVWNIAELSMVLSDNPLKVSPETARLPKEFYGHNFIRLFTALETAVNRLPKDATPERKYQLLKTKKLLGNLTVDDYFIFKVQSNSGVHGYSQDLSKIFQATTFQLRQEKRIEADYDFDGGCLGGSAVTDPPRGNSPEDFIKPVKDDSIWEKSYLLLNTVKPIYNKKNYKGKLDADSSVPVDCRFRYFVPSPQAQYELAFVRPQFFELSESKTAQLSLKDYEYYDRNGVGVIAWEAKGERLPIASDDYAETFFLVKLTAPFAKSETLETRDEIENKNFKMFSRTFFVDIASIFIVSHKTGKVVKKIGKIN